MKQEATATILDALEMSSVNPQRLEEDTHEQLGI